MAYHPLSNDTGGTAEERHEEACRILHMLEGYEATMSDKHRAFVEDMWRSETISAKQLFWLRDIKDKYL